MWENTLQVLYFQDFKFTSLENNEASHTGNYLLFPFVHVSTSRTAICLYSRRPQTHIYYPTALRRVQITPKTSTNIMQYFVLQRTG